MDREFKDHMRCQTCGCELTSQLILKEESLPIPDDADFLPVWDVLETVVSSLTIEVTCSKCGRPKVSKELRKLLISAYSKSICSTPIITEKEEPEDA